MSFGQKYFIAIDLGASHGSIISGLLRDKCLVLNESHSFIHSIVEKNGVKRWNWDYIENEITKGLNKACQDTGEEKIESISCSSWAQDFGLLNEQGEIFYKPVSYRDNRTHGLPYKFFDIINPEDLFSQNGSVLSAITTLCQLYSMVTDEAKYLSESNKFLFIADLVHYKLCRKAVTDWTFATASQMINLRARKWDLELAGNLGIPSKIYPEFNITPQVIGKVEALDIHPKLRGVSVVSGSGHDTAIASSIVLPIHEKTVFISLGTWAMLGCYDKDISLNCIDDYSISILGLPWGMIGEIIKYCKETDQAVPESPEDFAKVIFDSLALEFKTLIGKLERASGIKFCKIHIVSGGSKNKYLCSRIASLVGIPVIAGPAEATAIGNILLQAKVLGLVEDEIEVDEIINNSFCVITYNI